MDAMPKDHFRMDRISSNAFSEELVSRMKQFWDDFMSVVCSPGQAGVSASLSGDEADGDPTRGRTSHDMRRFLEYCIVRQSQSNNGALRLVDFINSCTHS
eukprot:1543688-Amphidinium_carterae.4